jgi:hypothetical protein
MAEPNDILGRRTLLTLHDIELHLLALGQRPESLSLDGTVVHEAVLAAILRRDETEALLVIEPLDRPGGTHPDPTPCCVLVLSGPVLPYHAIAIHGCADLTPRALAGGSRKKTRAKRPGPLVTGPRPEPEVFADREYQGPGLRRQDAQPRGPVASPASGRTWVCRTPTSRSRKCARTWSSTPSSAPSVSGGAMPGS